MRLPPLKCTYLREFLWIFKILVPGWSYDDVLSISGENPVLAAWHCPGIFWHFIFMLFNKFGRISNEFQNPSHMRFGLRTSGVLIMQKLSSLASSASSSARHGIALEPPARSPLARRVENAVRYKWQCERFILGYGSEISKCENYLGS